MTNHKTLYIVDDEPLARERLRRLVADIPGFDVIGEASDGRIALEAVCKLEPDVVLLDISMPCMSGIEVAHHFAMQPQPPAVIFCTAHDEYAIEAFRCAAVDYLLKPVRAEELSRALSNALQLNRAQVRELELTDAYADQQRTHISARSHRGIELLAVAEISHFVAEDKYVLAYHRDGETLLEHTLKALDEELGELFVRVHRNALVSVAHIEGLERLGSEARVRLRDTDQRPLVSRRHLRLLKELMANL